MRGETVIFFNGQFWIAEFAEYSEDRLARAGQFVFGAEPTQAEFDAWLAAGSPGLVMRRVDSSHRLPSKPKKASTNPKRAVRGLRRAKSLPNESAAQAALRATYEVFKKTSKKVGSQKKAVEKERRFRLKQEKKKKKLRGK